jgi:hypothetical protein
VAIDARCQSISDVERHLGMKEGSDVGLEMSGNPAALRAIIENMCHGAKMCLRAGCLPQFRASASKSQTADLLWLDWHEARRLVGIALALVACTNRIRIDGPRKLYVLRVAAELLEIRRKIGLAPSMRVHELVHVQV